MSHRRCGTLGAGFDSHHMDLPENIVIHILQHPRVSGGPVQSVKHLKQRIATPMPNPSRGDDREQQLDIKEDTLEAFNARILVRITLFRALKSPTHCTSASHDPCQEFRKRDPIYQKSCIWLDVRPSYLLLVTALSSLAPFLHPRSQDKTVKCALPQQSLQPASRVDPHSCHAVAMTMIHRCCLSRQTWSIGAILDWEIAGEL